MLDIHHDFSECAGKAAYTVKKNSSIFTNDAIVNLLDTR